MLVDDLGSVFEGLGHHSLEVLRLVLSEGPLGFLEGLKVALVLGPNQNTFVVPGEAGVFKRRLVQVVSRSLQVPQILHALPLADLATLELQILLSEEFLRENAV